MNRYKFSLGNLAKAIKFIGGKSPLAPPFAKKFKDDLTVKKKKLFYEDKEIVAKEKVDDLLRDILYKKDDTPSGRDSLFHNIKRDYIGISRRAVMEFLRKQKPLEDRPSVPAAKQKSGPRFKTYVMETDLVFLKRDDLERVNPQFARKDIPELSYFVSSCERITGLYRCDYVLTKEAAIVTPIVISHFESMCEELGVSPKDVVANFDKGLEFNIKQIREVMKSAKHVAMGPSIENKNRNLQKNFFNILKSRKARTIKTAMKKAVLVMNNTMNRIHQKTPLELVERGDTKENIKEYNAKRPKYIAGRKRELKVGDYVRVLIKKFKESLAYKTYKGQSWSEKLYIVKKKTKKVPHKYYVKSTWMLVDSLLKSAPRDVKTQLMLEQKDDEEIVRERVKRQEDYEASVEAEKKKFGKKRDAAVMGRLKKLKKQKKEDELLDREEDIDEGREREVPKKVLPQKRKREPVEKEDEEEVRKKEYIAFLRSRNVAYYGTIDQLKRRVRKIKKKERREKYSN